MMVPVVGERAGLPGSGGWTLDFRAISLLEGVRAAIAVAGTMAVGSLLGVPQLGLAALGALLACFADPGGPVRARLPPMLVFGVLGALCFSVFGLILARSPAVAIAAAGITIFACSLARIYGQGGLQTGNLISVAAVLSLDVPVRSVAAAVAPAVAFWAGATGAAALTLVLWRIRPFQPVRGALAGIARAQAALAGDLIVLAEAPGRPGEDGFDRHARGHRRAVREAIERARGVTYATIRRRGAASARANAIALRLATFDQVFGAMIALGEAMAGSPAAALAALPALRLLAPLLEALAPLLEADRSLDTPAIAALLARLRAAAGAVGGSDPVRRPLDVMVDRLPLIVMVSAAPAASIADGAVPGWRAEIVGPLRANFTLKSVSMRHALRTAVVTIPVLGFVEWLGNPFGHWLAITVIFVLQPHFSATWVRALERVAGTVAGGLLAALIGLVCHTRLELALAMIPLAMLAFAIRGVNYSAYTAVLTPMIVLLIEQIAPGTDQAVIALSRVGFTVAGGVLAVAANLVLWPGFEGNRLGAARDAAIKAHRDYLRASFAYLLGEGAVPDAARRQAGLASNNLEASVARALMEPHRGADALLRSALVVDAALRRVAGRLAVLGLDPAPAEGERDLWRRWRDWLEAAFDPALGPMPPVPEAVQRADAAESLRRLARQAALVFDAVDLSRWPVEQEGQGALPPGLLYPPANGQGGRA